MKQIKPDACEYTELLKSYDECSIRSKFETELNAWFMSTGISCESAPTSSTSANAPNDSDQQKQGSVSSSAKESLPEQHSSSSPLHKASNGQDQLNIAKDDGPQERNPQ